MPEGSEDLEQVTESRGWLLLRMLVLDGWDVRELKNGRQQLHGVLATRPGAQISAWGESFPEAALEAFDECVRWKRTAKLAQLDLFAAL